MSILLDVGIGLEINVLTSKFILLGDQMLGEMGCHPEICFYLIVLLLVLWFRYVERKEIKKIYIAPAQWDVKHTTNIF